MKAVKRVHKCQFCGRQFVRESWFKRHSCAKKKKFDANHDVVAQHAYRVYCYWMRRQNMTKRNKDPSFDKFLTSGTKNRFMELILFVRDQKLPSAYTYVDWLVDKSIMAKKWNSDDPLLMEQFQKYVDIYDDPVEQCNWTIRQIRKWVLERPDERSFELFFEKLSPATILTLLRNRVLRPWPLLIYPKIADKWLADDVYNRDTYHKINGIVDVDYWANKLEDDPSIETTVIEMMDQLWVSQT